MLLTSCDLYEGYKLFLLASFSYCGLELLKSARKDPRGQILKDADHVKGDLQHTGFR